MSLIKKFHLQELRNNDDVPAQYHRCFPGAAAPFYSQPTTNLVDFTSQAPVRPPTSSDIHHHLIPNFFFSWTAEVTSIHICSSPSIPQTVFIGHLQDTNSYLVTLLFKTHTRHAPTPFYSLYKALHYVFAPNSNFTSVPTNDF